MSAVYAHRTFFGWPRGRTDVVYRYDGDDCRLVAVGSELAMAAAERGLTAASKVPSTTNPESRS